MKCWIDIDILKQYRDGSVSEEEKETIRTHIEKCPKCHENLMLIDMIREYMQPCETADYQRASARIMARLDRQLYSNDKVSSHLKFLYHKLLPLRKKMIAGATAIACTVMAIAGVIAFDRTFGDFLSGRYSSRPYAGQTEADSTDPGPVQQPGEISQDAEPSEQPQDEGASDQLQDTGSTGQAEDGALPGIQPGDPSADGGQATDPVTPVPLYDTVTKLPHADYESLTIIISVTDGSGSLVDLTNASFYVASGNSVIWGRGTTSGGYNTERQLEGMAIDDRFQIRAYRDSEDIGFFICGNIGEDQAFYIYDTIKAGSWETGEAVQIRYSLDRLYEVSLDLDFMGRSEGHYEVTVFDRKLDHRQTESQGSMFRFDTDGTKSLMISPGSYLFAFKYLDTGTCGLAARQIDIPSVSEIRLAGQDMRFDRYVFTEPAAWRDYRYYIIQTGFRGVSFMSYLRGTLDDEGRVTVYVSKETGHYSPRIIYSKSPDTEYESSIFTFIRDDKFSNIEGERFVPSSIDAYIATDGKRAFAQYFADASGNECRFIDLPREKDMMMEIYDESGNELLHKFAYSKYWDYLEPDLAPGRYLVKVYPLVMEHGIDGSAEYVLRIGDIYKFIKRN